LEIIIVGSPTMLSIVKYFPVGLAFPFQKGKKNL